LANNLVTNIANRNFACALIKRDKLDLVAEDLQVDGWLEDVGIFQLSEWDAWTFFYRHGTSLLSAGQIALLLGHDKRAVGKALENLVVLGLVQRSRSSRVARFYRFASQSPRASMEQLLNLSNSRTGRLLVARRIVERERWVSGSTRAGLHLA
jgi:DNA-binding MarR family transcriptional regulator